MAITNTKDARVYVTARRDEVFLSLVEKSMKDKISPKAGQPFPVSELLDEDRISEFKNDGHNPGRFSGFLSERDLLIYRTDPALKPEFLIKNASSAFQFSYDPTNGIDSRGFIFKFIKIK